MKSAVVEIATDIVINIIIADPNVDPAPDGCFFVALNADPENPILCNIGWIYDPNTGTFYPPSEG